jgi:hypothetical protein
MAKTTDSERKKHVYHETNEIELGKMDCAFVLRGDGTFELYIPRVAEDDEATTESAALMSAIAMRIGSEEWCIEQLTWLREKMKEMK